MSPADFDAVGQILLNATAVAAAFSGALLTLHLQQKGNASVQKSALLGAIGDAHPPASVNDPPADEGLKMPPILTDLENGFAAVAHKVESWADILARHNPAYAADIAAVVSKVKQGVSNAIDLEDSALGDHAAQISKGIAAAVEAELAILTKGASVPYNAFVENGVDRLINHGVAELHALGLQIKATLAEKSLTPHGGLIQGQGAFVSFSDFAAVGHSPTDATAVEASSPPV